MLVWAEVDIPSSENTVGLVCPEVAVPSTGDTVVLVWEIEDGRPGGVRLVWRGSISSEVVSSDVTAVDVLMLNPRCQIFDV